MSNLWLHHFHMHLLLHCNNQWKTGVCWLIILFHTIRIFLFRIQVLQSRIRNDIRKKSSQKIIYFRFLRQDSISNSKERVIMKYFIMSMIMIIVLWIMQLWRILTIHNSFRRFKLKQEAIQLNHMKISQLFLNLLG